MKIQIPAAALAAAVASWLAVGAVQASQSAIHEARSIEHAKVSITEAIRTAEKKGAGQAISAEYVFKNGRAAFYEVKVLANDGQKLTRYDLDPNTGDVKEASNEQFEKVFTRIKPTSIRNAPTSLTRAIATAEARAGGKATAASVDRDGDQVKYTVTIPKLDGTTEKIKINGADGKVASAD